MAKDRASSILESARKASGREKKYKTTEQEKEQVSSGQTSTTNTTQKTTDIATSILESARKASGRNTVGGGRTSYSSAPSNNSKPASNALGSAGSLGAKSGKDVIGKDSWLLYANAKINAAKSKTTDEYYEKRYKEEYDRLTREHANDFSYPTAAQADNIVLKEMKSAQREAEAYEAEKQKYIKLSKLNENTEKILGNVDYEQNSKYSPAKPKQVQELKAEGYKQDADGKWFKTNWLTGAVDYYNGEDSDLYTYINDDSKRLSLGVEDETSVGTNTYELNGYHTLTEEEKGAFNYLYHQDRKNGTNTAEEYLLSIQSMLQDRALKLEEADYKKWAKESPFSASVVSLGTNFVNAVYFPAKLGATAAGQYDDMPMLDRYGNRTQAIRGAVSEDMGTAGKLFYNAGMSIGDMGLAMLAGGGNAKVVQAIMSSAAGSSAISTAKNNGASDGKAFIMGLGSAAIEWATEKYSVEALLRKPESILGYITTNLATEGTEEGVSNISNVALDLVVSEIFRDRNEIEQRIDYLVVYEDKTPEEAMQIVFNEKLQSLGEDVIVGAMAGFGTSTVTASPAIVQNGLERITRQKPTTTIETQGVTPTPTVETPTPTQTTSIDPIEQAAREVVAERARNSPALAVETMSINGETITPEDARKASAYGKHGSELLADAVNKAEGKSFSEVKGEMHIAYMAGYSNQNVNIKTDFEQEAYFAGKKDRIMDNTTAKEKAKIATVYESGVVKNDNFKKLSKASQEVLETLAKDHKLSVEMKDKIVASIVNGVERRAAGSHFDGKIEGSMATEKPLIKWAIHEDGHRMEQMATDEWNVLANALYERAERLGRRAELGLSQGTRFDKMKADHDRAGITKDTSGYFGEVVMRELETIFASPEEFNAWRAELDGNAQVKTAWQKFMDFLVELKDKAKATLAKATMSKEARAQARAEIAELEHIKELYANAYKATSEAVTKRANEVQTDTNSSKNLEIKTNEEYNGNISYAMEYWRTDLNAREFKQVEKWIRKVGSPETTKITDTANWYEGRINGEDLFVIYSTINADNPTILYEVKGNEAKVELNILKDFVEVFENGESINQESSYAGWVSQGSWMQEVNSSQNNLGNMGSGQNNQNVRVLQRQSQGNGSRAFWNVIETLYKRQEQDGELSKNKSYSLEESEIDDAINQSMTMEQAKDMIQRAFVIGEIKEWFDGEYKNGDEWLKGEGADSVAMVIENEWTLQQKFLDKIQGLMDEEFFVEDILEAYAKGTLTGKVKQNVVKRLDTSKPTSATDTRVFAPKDIKNAQEIYKVASERVTNANRDKVYQARADIIMFAHNRGAAETLGLTQTELNKKLATWARYTARAKEVSMRINKDVALFNKWTGIENSNVLNRATVSQEELNNLVNDIKGDSNGWQRSYIMRTMLALDTHIDYSELNFEFVGTPRTTFGKSVNGLYDNSNRKITVKYNAPHTVSHEMGHFLDYQWARDLGCSGALTDGFSRDKVDGDVKQFITNFDEFIEQIENVADLRSEYTMDRKEVFARFVAKFVQWVDIVANGKRSYAQEYLSYNDKFTATHYIEFVRLLQEKSMLDSKKFENKSFSLEESGINNSDTMYRLPSDVSFSLEDTEYLELAKDPTKNEKRLRELVDEAASRAGYTDDTSWRMQHTAPNSKDDVSLDKLKDSGLIPDDFWEHPEWYTHTPEEREAYYKIKNAIELQERLKSAGSPREAHLWVYRAVDKTKNKREDYFRNGDWVTPSKEYAINEGKMNPNGYRIIKHSVKIKDLYWDGNSIAELGYDDGNNYAYADTLNNRKLLDLVTYDYYGNVIPLSKRFNKRNYDIRYSLEEDTNSISNKDQKQLLDTIEQLKGQFEVTKFAKADAKKLAKMTRDILKEYDSKADTDETRKAIDELYQYIANGEGQNPAAWNDVYNRAYKIAQNIVENALVTDDYMYQEYKSLRDYLRNTPLKFNSGYDSAPTAYENFNDFRKKNMGRLKFTNDGMSIDSFYQELSSLYPEYFDSEEQTNTADQLERIVDVLDEIQPTEVNPFDGQVQQASMHLANDLINRFFDIPQAKPTFADKAERRVINTRIKAKKQLDRVREQRDIKIEKEKAKRRDSLAKMSEKKKASVLRARIMRHTGELHKTLIKATDQKHIPPELENAVLALLYNINLESNYTYDVYTDSYKKNDKGYPTNKTKAFLALKEMYAEIAKNNDYGLTLASELFDSTGEGVTNIFDEVMALSDKKIADMTSEELTKIYDAIRIVEHSILTANKMFAMKKWEGLSETAKAFEKSVATRRVKHALMKSHLTLDIETPITFFSHFGEAGNELFQAFRDSQDNEQVMIDELAERVQKIVSLEQVKKAEKELFEFTTTEGKKLTLSKAHIMDIYLLYNRKQGKKHLLYDPESEHFGNGIHQPEIKSKHIRRDSESTRLTKADLDNIISKLSDEDKAIADKLQKTTLKLAEWGNKACLDVFGYEKFNDPNYWTIKSAKESINQTPEKNKDIARSIKNMGSAKAVEEKATNALDIDGVFNVFNQHASDMITYAAWLGAMEDATKLYNYTFRDDEGFKTNRTFVSMLDKYAGEGGSKYYFNLMKDIQNGIGLAPDTATERIYTKLFGKMAKAKVAYKATVVAQQPTAIIRAASVINPLSILQAAAKGGVNLPAWAVSKIPKVKVDTSAWYGGWERALKYAPIASRKAIGGYEINSNDSGLKGVLFKPETKKGKAVEAVKESPLWAAGKADEITWGVLWNACEIETSKDKSLEKGSEEYYEAVSKLFTKVINETQVVDGVLQRSQLMRSSSGWIKPLTTFKGEPTMALNGVIRAYDNLRYETDTKKRGKAIKKFGRSVGVFAVSAVLTAFARSLAVGGTGEDDEEYWKKVWKSFSGIQGDEETWFDFVKNIGLKSDAVNNINPLTWLPITSEMMSLMQGYDVERLDVASIGDFMTEAKKFIDSLDKEGKQTVGYSARQVLLKAAEFTGYSPYNLIRDIEGAIRTVRVETNDVKGLYEMEKWRTRPASNVSKYVDILYRAYSTDSDDYEYIYNDMIENGVDAEKIEDGMEERMKDAEGVKKVSELTKRYMSPDVEKKYDNSLSKIRTSDVWKKANATQRKEAEADLYNFLTSDSDDMEKAREEAMLNGVDSSEYALWQIAIEMADQPKDENGSGSYDSKEKAEAINSLNLGEKEMAYFYGKGLNEYAKDELNQVISDGIDIQDYINFKAATSDMTADKNANGKSIPNSKKRKVVNYLNSANLTDEEWNYFYYEIMDYKK